MSELIVLKSVSPEIAFNEVEIEQELDRILMEYKDMIFTDEFERQCKLEIQDLNKLKDNMDKFRKKYKQELQIPIMEFENKIKRLIQKVEDVKGPLQIQYDSFEQHRKAVKTGLIYEVIEKIRAEYPLPEKYLNKIEIKPEYMNKTFDMKKVEDDLLAQFEKQYQEIEKMLTRTELMQSRIDFVNLKNNLQVPLSLDDFEIDMEKEITGILLRIDETGTRRAKAEAEAVERIRQAEEVKAEEKANIEVAKQVEEIIESVQKYIPPEITEDDEMLEVFLKISGTSEQLSAVAKYMKNINVKYEVMK